MESRQVGAVLLVYLTACASMPRGAPASEGETRAAHYEQREWVVEPAEPVKGDAEAFAKAMRVVARGVKASEQPRQTAQWLMEGGLEARLVAEADRGKVVRLMPLEEGTPLEAGSAERMKREYLEWCEKEQGGGDCLGLLADGPVLDREDVRVLALGMALGGVLRETRQALKEMVSPQAVVALVVFTASFYLALWLLPEPASKALAAALTLGLSAWLGAETLWGMLDGWGRLQWEADRATRFEEVREAGEKYGRVMGENTARVLVMLVTAALGGSGARFAQRLPKLAGYEQAAARAEAQGMRLAAAGEVEGAVVEGEGRLTFMVRRPGSQGGAAEAEGIVTVIRHQGGNRQVVVRGQRWHVPANRKVEEIPAKDPMGDRLQEAAQRVASRWNAGELSNPERRAIREAMRQGKHFQAKLWERMYRGRWVETQLREQFKGLKWNPQGVDVTDPATGYRYEVLSGTVSNMELHGRRMLGEFFRMITF